MGIKITVISNNVLKYDVCPECYGNLNNAEERGEIVCIKCGLIIEEKELDISHPERTAFTKEDKNKKDRTGPPISPLLSNISLTTLVSKKNVFNQDLKRVLEKDSYKAWEMRNLLTATVELKRLSFNLNLPGYIKNEALKLYKDTFKKKMIKGKSIKGMLAACIYFICKNKGVPRTFREIYEESPVSLKSLKICYKDLVNKFKLKAQAINPINYIPRFISKLKLDFEIEKLSTKILQIYLKEKFINGKNPLGFCAGAIYLALKLKTLSITQKTVADIVGVTTTTLRSRYKEIRTILI